MTKFHFWQSYLAYC